MHKVVCKVLFHHKNILVSYDYLLLEVGTKCKWGFNIFYILHFIFFLGDFYFNGKSL
jgi:hypothetical protein